MSWQSALTHSVFATAFSNLRPLPKNANGVCLHAFWRGPRRKSITLHLIMKQIENQTRCVTNEFSAPTCGLQCQHDIPHIHPSGCQGDGSALCWASQCGLASLETNRPTKRSWNKALKECLECKKRSPGNFKVFANYLSLLEKVTTQRFKFTKWDCMVTDTVKTENSRKIVHIALSKKHLSRQKVHTACILHSNFTPIQQKVKPNFARQKISRKYCS